MLNSRVIRLVMMLLLCQLCALPIHAQETLEGKYFPKIDELLDAGQCERAQRLYNVYKETSNRTNRDREKRIDECLNGIKDTLQSTLTFTVNGERFTMVYVPGGTFTMGAQKNSSSQPNYDPLADDDEFPVHSVTVDGFYMGKYEVTQRLWKAVMGNNPSRFKGDNLPVENVSWNDAQEFIEKLNRQTGRTFRLPTEPEWEYAARGGKSTSLYNGENITINGKNNSANLDRLAWYGGNCGQDYTRSSGCDEANGVDITGWPEKQYRDSRGGTHPVGAKQPNAFGLYDILGNVWEWCSDYYGPYGSGSQRDPVV